ncbi:MAG: ATP-binding protein [Acidobacteriota bacterium]
MTTKPDRGLSPPEALPADERKWRDFQVKVQKSRALVYSTGIAVACVAKLVGEFQWSWWLVGMYVCLSDGSSLLFGLAFRRGLRRILGVSLQALWMGSDVLLIAWLIHITGGSQSYWFPWALANVAAAAFLIGRRGIVVIMAANTIAYLAMTVVYERPSLQTLIILTFRVLILYAAAFFALIGISNLQAKRRLISTLRSQEMQRAAELAESEERYRALFESAASPYFVLDPDRRAVIDANVAATLLCGRGRKELVGRLPSEIGIEWLNEVMEKTPADMQPGPEPVLVRHLAGSGELRDLEVRAQHISLEGRLRVLVMAQDVTERRRLQEERLRSSRVESLGLLAGGIAHDFNNVLAAVLGNVSLARHRGSRPEEVSVQLAAAEIAIQRAKRLTGQLLAFAKGGAPVKRTTDLGKLIRESASFALTGSNSSCTFQIPGDLWCADIDEGQFAQVISNIVINADQASPGGGPVVVRCENASFQEATWHPLEPGAYVKVSITDHGIGMPAGIRERVFDPYFTTKQNGSGLGLSTAYAIVRNHNGHLAIDSTPGLGTTVCIYIPALPEKAAAEPEPAIVPRGRGRVLVMDDEPELRMMYEDVLSELGYEAEAVADGGAAVRRYEEACQSDRPFDCIIMDLTVPGRMGGKEALATLKISDPEVIAIVASGYSNDPVLADYRAEGFAAALAKPFTISELARTLDDLLHSRRAAAS